MQISKHSPPLQLKFVKPASISDYLKCAICMQVFKNAIRLYCGHTFCQVCIQLHSRVANTCPQCRQNIVKSKIGIDLLARQIINQFQVFCPKEDCPWKGTVSEVQNHLQKQCLFLDDKKNKQKQKQKVGSYQNEEVDERVQQKINQHIVKGSLQARIMSRGDLLVAKDKDKERENIQANIQHKSNNQNTQKKPLGMGMSVWGQSIADNYKCREKIDKRKKESKKQEQTPKTTNYDFLSDLFE